MQPRYVPAKGDVVWLEFPPQTGHEQAGRRPALCISPKEYNEKVELAIFCPITSKQKGYPFEVVLPSKFPINGVILVDHVKNLDWKTREAEFIASMPSHTLKHVIEKLMALLGK